jgi:hypothetical protein
MTSTTDDRPATASANNSGAGADGNEGTGGRTAAARQAFESARDRTAAAYATARERAGSAYETAGRRTSESIESNPIAAVAGGLALGAIVAALLPRTSREEELFGSAGRRINDTAREAARAAREAGRQQLDELGLTKEGLRSRLDGITDQAVGVARSSAGAAAGTVKKKG